MTDIQGLERISTALEHFAEGNPMYFEVDVAEGVWFDFDCPASEDLKEPVMPVCVGFKHWSPHSDGEPEGRLMDYGNGFGDELVADLEAAFYNGGSRNEEVVFEYSRRNSAPEKDIYIFLGSIHNPAMPVVDEPKGVPA